MLIFIKGSFEKDPESINNNIQVPKIYKEWDFGVDTLMANNRINKVDH